MPCLNQLIAEHPALDKAAQNGGPIGYFAQETIRFISIAGTLTDTPSFSLDHFAHIDERRITHILFRSLLEGQFRVLFIFDDPSKINERYQDLLQSFQYSYRKMANDAHFPTNAPIEPPDPNWTTPSKQPLNIADITEKIMDSYGARFRTIYYLYRISSFDVHGMSLEVLFNDSFGKSCPFPVLDIKGAIETLANNYLGLFNDLRQESLI